MSSSSQVGRASKWASIFFAAVLGWQTPADRARRREITDFHIFLVQETADNLDDEKVNVVDAVVRAPPVAQFADERGC